MKRRFYSVKFLYIFLLFFTFVIHSSYLSNGFTWLDHRDIEEKHAVVSIAKLPESFFHRYGDTGFYRPMVTVLNSIDEAVYKQYAPGYHLTNLLFFLAIIAAIPFFLVTFFGLSFQEGSIAALIVSVHPFGFLPVGAISYRPELLFTLFSLLTIILYIKNRQTKNKRFLFLSLLCFLIALLSKETALILIPSALVLWELSLSLSLRGSMTKQSRIKNPRLTKNRFIYTESASLPRRQAGFLALTIVYIFLRLHAVPELWRVSTQFPSASMAIGTRLFIVGKLLANFFLPFLPTISDATPIVGLTTPIAISTLFILFILLVLLFRVGINKPFGKALGLFLLFLAPALNIIPTPRMSSPHYGFIALIPFSVLILFILEWLLSHDRITAKLDWDSITSLTLRSRMTIFFFFLWLIAAGIATFQNGSRFRNDQTLFTMEAVHDPNFHEANFYLGTYYLKQKNYTAAENAFRATLQPSSGFIAYSERYSSLTNLAAVYYATNRFTDADIALQLAQKAAPPAELSHVFYDRAIIASQQRQYTTVIQLLDKPEFQTNPLALLMLADAFHYLGRNKEALATLEHSRLYWNAAQRKQIDRLIQQTQKEEVN